MPKITCADLRCKFRSTRGLCKAEKINLSQNSIMTLYNGRQEFNTCRTMQESEDWQKLKAEFEKIIKKEEK